MIFQWVTSITLALLAVAWIANTLAINKLSEKEDLRWKNHHTVHHLERKR